MSSRKSWVDFRLKERKVGDLPSGGDPLWALVYPQGYEVGMANLGVHSVYRALRERGVAAERFFKNPFPDISVENDRPISDFRLLTASVVYEPDMTSLLSMLKKWRIPATWIERKEKDSPILGVGGGISYINPLGLSKYADFIALGDGEEIFDHLVDAVRDFFRHHGNRRRLWETLAENASFFVPPIHLEQLVKGRPLSRKKSICLDLSAAAGKSTWITPRSVFPDSFLVETQRGCYRKCPFCTIPACFGPPRTRPKDLVLKDIDAAKEYGALRLGIIAPESGDYPWISDVIATVRQQDISVSFASLRLDSLTPEMLEVLSQSGQRTLTVAPETGDDELRKKCGKPFTQELIIEKLKLAREKGITKTKMYFMLGLPNETVEHILETARFISLVRRETGLKTVASFSIFVPKPQTPWQDNEFSSLETIETKTRLLRKNLLKTGTSGVELRFPSYREADEEYNLAWCLADSDLVFTRKKKARHDTILVKRQLELLGFQRNIPDRGEGV